MIITFPHMGKMYIPVKALFDDLKVKIVIPPKITKDCLEIGTRISPEMACLPLKINLGNYIESIKRGADTIVLSGSCGPCRFGYYGIVQKEILHDMGYEVEFIIIDPPKEGMKNFLNNIKRVSGNKSWSAIIRAFRNASRVTEENDVLYDMVVKKRAREAEKGLTNRIIDKYERDIFMVNGSKEILSLIEVYKNKISSIEEIKGIRPLNIGIVGEIYTLIEPFVNLNIEKKLGEMGVEVVRSITLDEWLKTHLSLNIKHKLEQKKLLKKATPYLDLCVGGHAWQTIAYSLQYADNKIDGIIQLMPFGCMPEIVAESILPHISREKNTPIMTLTVDELTGEAGYHTRLEAFVDLLNLKRGNVYEQETSVHGC